MAEPALIVEWEEKKYLLAGHQPQTKVRREGRVVGYVSDLHGSFRAIVISENKFAAVQLDDLTIVK